MSRKYSNDEVVETLLNFALFIYRTYGLVIEVDGKLVQVKPTPDMLVAAWHDSIQPAHGEVEVVTPQIQVVPG